MDPDPTKIINDLSESNIKESAKYLYRKVKDKEPSSFYRGAKVYHLGDLGTGYILLVDQDKVVYFVRHKKINYSGFSLGRQVLLWRDKDSGTVTDGFAQSVFFNVLLKKYGALIADKEQTRNGSAFWGNAITSAFARNLHVYCFDRRGDIKLTELKNEDDVWEYADILWGKTPAHIHTFAVISSKPLKLRTTPRVKTDAES